MGGDGRLAPSFLDAATRVGRNVVASGGTQTGKTTVLNCLAASIPGTDRVVSAEEFFELRFHHPNRVPLQTRQPGARGRWEIRLRDLVRESLRMRPSRIIISEARSEECLDVLLALNAWLPGMCAARQQRPRGVGDDVHPPAAGGREHLTVECIRLWNGCAGVVPAEALNERLIAAIQVRAHRVEPPGHALPGGADATGD